MSFLILSFGALWAIARVEMPADPPPAVPPVAQEVSQQGNSAPTD